MSWNDSWRRRRHHPAIRLCAHSHEWIVRWLEQNGWRRGSVSIPTRAQVLRGDPDPGWQHMVRLSNEHLCREGLRVPGARTPKARISCYEWHDFLKNPDTGLERAYHLLGLDIPPLRNRLRRQ